MTKFLAAAALTFAGTVAHASTISLNATNATAIGDISGQDFQTQLTNAGATHLYDSGPLTLTAAEPVKLTFSWVAAESGFQNTLLAFAGSELITEDGNKSLDDFTTGALSGQSFERNFFGGDLASLLTFSAFDFSTSTSTIFTSSDEEFGVFADASQLGNLSTFYLALDDSGANNDDNHDDIIIRVDVAAVPLPASGLLLLAGLAGAFGMRRFRKEA